MEPAIGIVIFAFLVSFSMAIKIYPPYERAVIFRLGKFKQVSGARTIPGQRKDRRGLQSASNGRRCTGCQKGHQPGMFISVLLTRFPRVRR